MLKIALKMLFVVCVVCWDMFVFVSFATAQCGMQFSSRGVRPGLTTMIARHLDKNTMGYLQWRWGTQSSMNTSIVRDTKSSHFTFAVQVGRFTTEAGFSFSRLDRYLFYFYHNSWEFHIRSWWWATSTNSRMMIRPRSRAQSSMYAFFLFVSDFLDSM